MFLQSDANQLELQIIFCINQNSVFYEKNIAIFLRKPKKWKATWTDIDSTPDLKIECFWDGYV